MKRSLAAAALLALLVGAVPVARAATGPLCGTGKNAAICFASVDRGGQAFAC
jgi:hypothetical protein